MTDIIKFDLPEAAPSIIMVAGIGGGGSNAVNYMHRMGITDVSFMICNTDLQALNRSQIPIKIVLGQSLTQGLGAGNKPEIGRAAAEESFDEIVEIFRKYNTRMVFVTAGMGGGTGTGAAPVIARAARELGILTVAIVTIPFKTEGRKRLAQALEGIEEIRKYVDSLLVIDNENILEMYGELALSEAFGMADDILASAAKGIAEIITGDSYVNVDFKDVQTVMSNSGVALMGSAKAGGENRADQAVRAALSSPLLNHRDISGAASILINITYGNKEVTMTETHYITEYVQKMSGYAADLIWGAGRNESLGDDIQVTVIATGFNADIIENISGFEDKDNGDTDENPAGGQTGTQAPGFVPPSQGFTPPSQGFTNPGKADTAAPARQGFVPPANAGQDSPFRSKQAVGKTTIVSSGDSEGYLVTEQQPGAAKQQLKREDDGVNYDELEKTPAWVRRKMSFSDTPSDDKASRVTLREDKSSTPPPEQPKNKGLFE